MADDLVLRDANVPMFDPAAFDHMQRLSQTLAAASILPDHLKVRPAFLAHLRNPSAGEVRQATAQAIQALGPEEVARQSQEAALGTAGNMFLVVNAARRWGFDPIAVAGSSYVVGGKLAFEGKLVHAVINTQAPLEGKLRFAYNDQTGDNLTVTVSARLRGESEDRTVQVRVGDVKTQNQMWSKDPRQKLIYTGAIKWARAHCPEIILGVLTDDDREIIEQNQAPRQLPPKDVTPRALPPSTDTVKARLKERAGTAPESRDTSKQGVGMGDTSPSDPGAEEAGSLQSEIEDPLPDAPIQLSDEEADTIRGYLVKNKIEEKDLLLELGSEADYLELWSVEVTEASGVRWATADELKDRAREAVKAILKRR